MEAIRVGFPVFLNRSAPKLHINGWTMKVPEPPPSLESLLAHSEWLEGLARSLMADRASADDLVQDAWVAALRNPPRRSHAVRAWFSRVARRLARRPDPLRDAAGELARAREDLPPTDEVVARIEQERLLAKFVVELKEPYRKVVLQHFYLGLSAAQIARSETVPSATVRTRLRRALALLRERLEGANRTHGRAWPLASLLLVRPSEAMSAANHGVILMSTKTTVAVSVASGALCALAVSEGILPRLEDRAGSEQASASWVAAAEPGMSASRGGPGQASTSDALSDDPALPGPSDLDGSATSARTPVRAAHLSPEDLRKLLHSSKRLDQVRAIELLRSEGSAAANRVLLDAFLASKDPVLLALLEEAMLGSPLAFAPAILEAFDVSEDPEMLARLAKLLTKFVESRPELEHDAIQHLLGSLEEAEGFPDRAEAATGALVALGERATDELAAFLVDPGTDPSAAGSAAWAISQLSSGHGELVREKLADGLRSLGESDHGSLTEAERQAIQKKTGSIAWATSLRPEEEHDGLGEVLLGHLLQTRDPAQAGTLTWSLGRLGGLSDRSREGMTRDLLDALGSQEDASLRSQYVQTLKALTSSRRAGPQLGQLIRLIEDHQALQRRYGQPTSTIDSLLEDLRQREEGKSE